ncbi:MAG: hypothetical protein LBU91_00535 [Bacteroidales bacterium]|jgi:hypothetical protein|nr:hypothetical protein [Bacteroidales bacterium]
MSILEHIKFWIETTSGLFTIITAGIAIVVYLKNKDKISSTINFVLNYSKQMTLFDIKHKIERLNDYNADDSEQKKEIINILSEINGQITGNKIIQQELSEQFDKINKYLLRPASLTQPNKRGLVSELREAVKNIDVMNYQKIIKK